jgi:alpha-L-fucosidase
MTLNRHWGYNRADKEFKSPTEVIHNLADIAHKGGNYLLNVGPTADGMIPQESGDILAAVGAWLKTNGESIYGTSASPLPATPVWGRVTQKDKTLYLHVLDWPTDGRIHVHGLPGVAKRAYALADAARTPLHVMPAADVLTIAIPAIAPDVHASVIAVEL